MKTCLLLLLFTATVLRSGEPTLATRSVNELGIRIFRSLSAEESGNLCISPFSIQTALAMTFAGADGVTRKQMAQVLGCPESDAIHGSSSALQTAIETAAKRARKWGDPAPAIEIALANRLYGERNFDFQKPFLDLVSKEYQGPLERLDFREQASRARDEMNEWVESKTHKRIRDLIGPDMVTAETQLVLINALYFKGNWQEEFNSEVTKNRPFHISGKQAANVPTMSQQEEIGYLRGDRFGIVALPYAGGEFQLVLFVPDSIDGLRDLKGKITPQLFEQARAMPPREVLLFLPKFKMAAPTLSLAKILEKLGMASAFDFPQGTADFSRMAPRKGDEYLVISEVAHKAFVEVNEVGTEAAAATAVLPAMAGGIAPSKPVVVRVDRPFLFAIQHIGSGACLFLGRVTDPR